MDHCSHCFLFYYRRYMFLRGSYPSIADYCWLKMRRYAIDCGLDSRLWP